MQVHNKSFDHYFAVIIGSLVIVLAVIIMVGWLGNFPQLVYFKYDTIYVTFNTCICFVLAGIGLIAYVHGYNKITLTCGVLILIVLALITGQYFLPYNIDQLLTVAWLSDETNLYPGRMSILSEFMFLLVSCILILLSLKQHTILIFYFITAFILAIVMMGTIVLLTYLLNLEFLFNWFQYTRMSYRVGIGYLLLGLGFAFAIRDEYLQIQKKREHDVHYIAFIMSVILAVVTILTSFASFAVVSTQFEKTVNASILELLKNKRAALEENLQRPLIEIDAIANRGSFKKLAPTSDKLAEMDELAALLKDEGFDYVAVYDNRNRLVYQKGFPLNNPKQRLQLNYPHNAELLWNQRTVEQFTLPLMQNNTAVGKLILQWPLPFIDDLNNYGKGRRIEARICRRTGLNSALCLPTHLSPSLAPRPLKKDRRLLGTGKALLGSQGVSAFLDYNNNLVVGGYSRVGNSGLGLILKNETKTLYQPILYRLYYILPALLIVMSLGVLAIRWQIVPLIDDILSSQKKMKSLYFRIKQKDEKLDAIIDNVGEAIITINYNGVIQSFNQAAEKIFGYSEQEVIGQNVTLLIPPHLRKQHLKAFSNYINTHEGHVVGKGYVQLEGLRKDGNIFPIELVITEISNLKLFSGIIRDITERKKVEDMKNEFISTVSHELRTPLTSIRGSIGLLIGGAVGELSEQGKTLLTIAEKNCERLIRLINDILDIEKIQSGRMHFDIQSYELAPLIKDAIDSNKNYAEKFGVKLRCEQIESVMVNVDRDRLIQVITNLISNAVKFSPEGAIVTVSTLRHKDAIRVKIADEGQGIPVELQSKIFEKFVQGSATNIRRMEGTGLGLNISKAIIEKLQGNIDFKTSSKGTTFYFDLPLVSSPLKTAASELKLQTKGASIIICESDKRIADFLVEFFVKNNYDVQIVSNASRLKEYLEKIKYDAVLIDLALRDSDGYTIINSIRSDSKLSAIPIVAFSIRPDVQGDEFDGGVFILADWITKPYISDRLLSAINALKNYLSDRKPNILHVEDDSDLAHIIHNLLQPDANIAWADTVAVAKTFLESNSYDVVILDLKLPDGSGVELLPELSAKKIPVIVFSAYEMPKQFTRYIASYLVKSKTSNDELLNVTKSVIFHKGLSKDSK